MVSSGWNCFNGEVGGSVLSVEMGGSGLVWLRKWLFGDGFMR